MVSFEDNCFVLPAEVVCHSAGFSMDAGGSVTKVVYRSSKDYENGVPINSNIPKGKGFLRLASFQADQVDELICFLQRECDINYHTTDKPIYMAGVATHCFQSQIKDKLNISCQVGFEFDFMMRGLHLLCQYSSLHELVHQEDSQGVQMGEAMEKTYRNLHSIADFTQGDMFSQKDPFHQMEKREKKDKGSVAPFLLAQLGSAIVIHKVKEDWSYNLVELSRFGGRSFLGIASCICGKNESFSDLMALAEKGVASNVDVHSNDVQSEEELATAGRGMFDNSLYFLFGKPAYQSRGNFSKADLMASWVNTATCSFVEHIHLTALAHGVDRVLITGGFCNSAVTRCYITKHWHGRTMHAKGLKIDMHFLKNGQFLPALGAYIQCREDIMKTT